MKYHSKSGKSTDKRTLILNTMRELFKEGSAGTASVNDIAKRAGIAKGGLYYYFHSKEEVMDALIEEEYKLIIQNCDKIIKSSSLSAIDQLALLLNTYRSSYMDPSLDEYLHMPQNAALHQKSLANILYSLSPIISHIIQLGVSEGTFHCDYPDEYAEIILTVFSFLLDPGIFNWTRKQYQEKLVALADILERSLQVPKGSFSFFSESPVCKH